MGQNTNRYVKDFKTDNNGNTTDVRLNTDETFGIQDEDLEERVEYLEQTLASMLTNTGLLRIAKGGTEADNASDALKNLIDGLQSISQITGSNYDIIIQRVIGDEDLGKVFAINLADAVLSSIPNPLPINRGGTNAQTVNDIIANVLNTNAVVDGAVRDDGVFPYKCDSAYAQGNNIGKISLSQIWDWLHNIKETATLEDVNSITAKYITSSAAGAAFADEAALAGDKYYAGQIITTSTSPALGNNDYCIVLDSGASHNNATARYVYQEGNWVFQYVVSQVTLNQAQLDALNSGITAAKVTKLDGVETGAQVNVQSDWNEADPTSDKYIENKPNISTVGNGVLSFYFNGESTPTATFSANQETNASVGIETICYGECNTAGSTATKTITPPPVSYFQAGAKVSIKFANANTAAAPTLDITAEDTPIRIADEYGNLPASGEAVNLWLSGEIVDFIYDGTYWRIMRKDHNPVGTIIAHANSNAPAGYILCDGRQLATSQYPQLYAACYSTYNTYSGGTPSSGYFRIPDLRETTLVGAGTRASRVTRHLASSTAGMSAGVFYDDALQGHKHEIKGIFSGSGTGAITSNERAWNSSYVESLSSNTVGSMTPDATSHGTPRIDYTTHGKIMAIYYYIKYF